MANKYWFKSGVNAAWNTVTGNWWNDASHTSQALSIPVTGDYVYLLGSTVPSTTPAAVTLSGFDTQSLEAHFSFLKTQNITIQSGGDLIMGNAASAGGPYTHEWNGTTAAVGTFVFSDNSNVSAGGVVGDYAIFNDLAGASLDSIVGDYAIFNDSSGVTGVEVTVGDYATFNDSATSTGIIGDYAVFNDTASTTEGTLGDFARFNDTSAGDDTTFGDYVRIESSGIFTGITLGLTAENSGNIIGG